MPQYLRYFLLNVFFMSKTHPGLLENPIPTKSVVMRWQAKRCRNKRILGNFYGDTTSKSINVKVPHRHCTPYPSCGVKKPPMLTDFDGKRTLQKKCALRGQHNSPGKEHALKAHAEVLLQSMFLRELFSPLKKQRIKTALVEAPAAESAALGSFV